MVMREVIAVGYGALATAVINNASRDLWKGFLSGDEAFRYTGAKRFFQSTWCESLMCLSDGLRSSPVASVIEYAVLDTLQRPSLIGDLERLLSEDWLVQLGGKYLTEALDQVKKMISKES